MSRESLALLRSEFVVHVVAQKLEDLPAGGLVGVVRVAHRESP
jgi:hypothetical protein